MIEPAPKKRKKIKPESYKDIFHPYMRDRIPDWDVSMGTIPYVFENHPPGEKVPPGSQCFWSVRWVDHRGKPLHVHELIDPEKLSADQLIFELNDIAHMGNSYSLQAAQLVLAHQAGKRVTLQHALKIFEQVRPVYPEAVAVWDPEIVKIAGLFHGGSLQKCSRKGWPASPELIKQFSEEKQKYKKPEKVDYSMPERHPPNPAKGRGTR